MRLVRTFDKSRSQFGPLDFRIVARSEKERTKKREIDRWLDGWIITHTKEQRWIQRQRKREKKTNCLISKE